MSMRRSAILTLCFTVCCFFAAGQSYPFKNFNSTNGLPTARVYNCFQDSKGYMWFGTETGAVRFDGKTFSAYTIDEGLSDNEIFSVCEDSQDRTWFLTFSGRPSYLKNDTFYNASNNRMLARIHSEKSLHTLSEDPQKRIWIASLGLEFFVMSDKGVKKYDLASQGAIKGAISFVQHEGEMWICTEAGFFHLEGDCIRAIQTAYIPCNFRMVKKLPDGRILFMAKEGMIEMKGRKQRIVIPRDAFSLPWPLMTGMYVDAQEKIWIPTLGKGVYLYDKTPAGYVFDECLLGDKIVTSVSGDHEGNYWFSTVGEGVYLLPSDYRKYHSYTMPEGLANNYVYAVTRDHKGRIWAGLNGGLVQVIDGHNIKTFDLNRDREAYLRTIDMVRDRHDNMWLITDRSLVKFPANRLGPVFITDPGAMFNTSPKNLEITPKGEVSFTTGQGVVRILKEDDRYIFQKPLYFESKRTFTHHVDSKGRFWVASIEGLTCYEGMKVTKYGYRDERLRKRITDIRELNDSVLVLSTYGYGVLLVKSGKVMQQFTAKEGLSGNICRKLFISDDHTIWVATNKGVSKISYRKDYFSIAKFSTYNGLLSDDVNDVYADSSGIYMATTGGLSVIREAGNRAASDPPPVMINRVMNEHENITKHSGIRLASNHSRLLVDFVALSYSSPLEISYQYRLGEQGGEWETTRNTTVEFSSLRPGKYRFELRARKENSAWSEPVSFSFSIAPPWWLNGYFLVPSLLLLLLVSGLIIWLRIRSSRRKETERLLIRNEMIQLEQKALQAMMNPHFIFNVMNSIQNYMNSHDQFAVNQYLASFARLIRKNMDIATAGFISLDEEIEYLSLYLSLEKLRFEGKLQYHITKDKALDADELTIPSMLLQPFVENAIWHGIMPLEEAGYISIRFMAGKDELHIEIRDNGVGIDNSIAHKSPEKDYVSRGINLVTERIRLINKTNEEKIGIRISQLHSDGERGTLVQIRMPFRTTEAAQRPRL